MLRCARVERPTCIDGHPLGKIRNKGVPWFEPGACEVCGIAPLHGALATCRCSFWKNGKRVCRECAIGIDYIEKDGSRITESPFSAGEVLRMKDLFSRGLHSKTDTDHPDKD